ncbi:glycosyltransferase family 2 protein [Hazenella sp. IB182353]|uniref:glycosyltransferase family 2 protein n=1 Tax=Polycladospora coralii TaxID=2771432 RepID=UPI001747B435|nr:glycosyltransferase family 2 protein [Polycladospora coralii]MBS7532018.1 glycosyltransferase family 2 protein [Polycladospora coralii]
MSISILVPCFNEELVIKDFYDEVTSILVNNNLDFELVFINDGSTDGTLNILKKIASKDKRVQYVSFSRNFGKESAMLAGLSYCRGLAVVIMDADLQHPPSLIPEMIKNYESGYDQVIAKRNRKGESQVRSIISKLYYKVMNKLVDIELVDGIGDFRLLSRRAVDALLALNENNRFSKGLFSWIGFNEYIIEYDNVNREVGTSKWSFPKLLNYGIDGVISFNNKPLRISIYIGTFVTIIDILYVIFTLFQIIVTGVQVPGYFTTIAIVSLIGGIQLIFLGIIGEYIGRIYYEAKSRPHYIVQETNCNELKQDTNETLSSQSMYIKVNSF